MRINRVIFIKNAIVLTVTSLLLRLIGVFFRVWLAAAIGAEGIGLYQQIFSVYVLVSTFASSGVGIAVTRLISDEMVFGSRPGIAKILRRCVVVTLAIALGSAAVVFIGSDFIAATILSDERAAPALRILTLSLPFMGISACIKGYFIARKKTAPGSSSQIFEQLVRIGMIVFLIGRTAGQGLAASCKAVLLGDAVAEVCSCLYLYIAYLFDRKKLDCFAGRKYPNYSVLAKLRHIALPIASGRYLNSFLRTAENILVPANLEKSGMSSETALSKFGMIKGMALPILFFPASFLSALATLLIPEMSEAAAAGKTYKVKYAAEKSIHITLISGFPFAAIFFFAADSVGRAVYGEADVGTIIRLLAPIVPLMYMDSVADGLLKGLDEQIVTFRNSIFDSTGRLILILLLLPRLGMAGFIGIMYVSNLFTSLVNLRRLIKVSRAKIKPFLWALLPMITAAALTLFADTVLRLFALSDILYITLLSVAVLPLYAGLMFLFGCMTPDDLK